MTNPDAAEMLGYLATRRYRQSPISGLRRVLGWDKRRFGAALTVLSDAELIALSPNTVALRDPVAPIGSLLDRLTEHHATLSHQERTDAENTDAGSPTTGGK